MSDSDYRDVAAFKEHMHAEYEKAMDEIGGLAPKIKAGTSDAERDNIYREFTRRMRRERNEAYVRLVALEAYDIINSSRVKRNPFAAWVKDNVPGARVSGNVMTIMY